MIFSVRVRMLLLLLLCWQVSVEDGFMANMMKLKNSLFSIVELLLCNGTDSLLFYCLIMMCIFCVVCKYIPLNGLNALLHLFTWSWALMNFLCRHIPLIFLTYTNQTCLSYYEIVVWFQWRIPILLLSEYQPTNRIPKFCVKSGWATGSLDCHR